MRRPRLAEALGRLRARGQGSHDERVAPHGDLVGEAADLVEVGLQLVGILGAEARQPPDRRQEGRRVPLVFEQELPGSGLEAVAHAAGCLDVLPGHRSAAADPPEPGQGVRQLDEVVHARAGLAVDRGLEEPVAPHTLPDPDGAHPALEALAERREVVPEHQPQVPARHGLRPVRRRDAEGRRVGPRVVPGGVRERILISGPRGQRVAPVGPVAAALREVHHLGLGPPGGLADGEPLLDLARVRGQVDHLAPPVDLIEEHVRDGGEAPGVRGREGLVEAERQGAQGALAALQRRQPRRQQQLRAGAVGELLEGPLAILRHIAGAEAPGGVQVDLPAAVGEALEAVPRLLEHRRHRGVVEGGPGVVQEQSRAQVLGRQGSRVLDLLLGGADLGQGVLEVVSLRDQLETAQDRALLLVEAVQSRGRLLVLAQPTVDLLGAALFGLLPAQVAQGLTVPVALACELEPCQRPLALLLVLKPTPPLIQAQVQGPVLARLHPRAGPGSGQGRRRLRHAGPGVLQLLAGLLAAPLQLPHLVAEVPERLEGGLRGGGIDQGPLGAARQPPLDPAPVLAQLPRHLLREVRALSLEPRHVAGGLDARAEALGLQQGAEVRELQAHPRRLRRGRAQRLGPLALLLRLAEDLSHRLAIGPNLLETPTDHALLLELGQPRLDRRLVPALGRQGAAAQGGATGVPRRAGGARRAGRCGSQEPEPDAAEHQSSGEPWLVEGDRGHEGQGPGRDERRREGARRRGSLAGLPIRTPEPLAEVPDRPDEVILGHVVQGSIFCFAIEAPVELLQALPEVGFTGGGLTNASHGRGEGLEQGLAERLGGPLLPGVRAQTGLGSGERRLGLRQGGPRVRELALLANELLEALGPIPDLQAQPIEVLHANGDLGELRLEPPGLGRGGVEVVLRGPELLREALDLLLDVLGRVPEPRGEGRPLLLQGSERRRGLHELAQPLPGGAPLASDLGARDLLVEVDEPLLFRRAIPGVGVGRAEGILRLAQPLRLAVAPGELGRGSERLRRLIEVEAAGELLEELLGQGPVPLTAVEEAAQPEAGHVLRRVGERALEGGGPVGPASVQEDLPRRTVHLAGGRHPHLAVQLGPGEGADAAREGALARGVGPHEKGEPSLQLQSREPRREPRSVLQIQSTDPHALSSSRWARRTSRSRQALCSRTSRAGGSSRRSSSSRRQFPSPSRPSPARRTRASAPPAWSSRSCEAT